MKPLESIPTTAALLVALTAGGQSDSRAGAAAPVQKSSDAAAATPPIVAVATVDSFWSADLFARVPGYVAEVRADLGDEVKKGQILALLTDPELDKELAAAQATRAARESMVAAAESAAQQTEATLEVTTRQLGALEAERRLAETTLRREEELFATKAATDQQIDDARTRDAVAAANVEVARSKIASGRADVAAARAGAEVARSQVAVAEAEVARYEARVGYLRIVAPFDGVVTRRTANPGDLVDAAGRAAPLFTCRQLDTVRILCDVPEESAARVAVGDPAEVRIFALGDEAVPGRVTRTARAIDEATRKMRTEIDLPNPDGRLRPGMYAEARITPSGARPRGPR